MKKTVLGIVFILLMASATAATLVHQAAGHSGVVLGPAWTSTPPTIDGIIDTSVEWALADTESFTLYSMDSPQRSGVAYIMNDNTNLYLAVKIQDSHFGETFETRDLLSFHFDNDHDAGYSEDGDESLMVASFVVPGIWDDYFNATRPTWTSDEYDGGTNDGWADASGDGTYNYFELQHPLDSDDDDHDFSLYLGQTIGFHLSYSSGGLHWKGTWPQLIIGQDHDMVIANMPSVYVSPPNLIDPSLTVGSTFSVNLAVMNVVDLYGWQIAINWDTTVLDVTDVTYGPLLASQPLGTIQTSYIVNEEGWAAIAEVTRGAYPGVSSVQSWICTITFSVKAFGETVLDISSGHDGIDTYYVDSSMNVIGDDPGELDIGNGYFNNMPTVEEPEAYIEFVNDTIQDLPNEAFSRPEEDVQDVKNDFSDLFDDALENIEEGNYEAAIEKLNMIMQRIYEEMVDSAERDEQISMIEDLIAYLETLL